MDAMNRLARKYGLLALDREAPLPVLRQMYRALALLVHPDKGGSEEDMKALNDIRDFFQGFADSRRADPDASAAPSDGGVGGVAMSAEAPRPRKKARPAVYTAAATSSSTAQASVSTAAAAALARAAAATGSSLTTRHAQ